MMKFRRLRFIILPSDFTLPSAIAVMLEKHGIACDLMHGFNWDGRMSNEEFRMSN